MVHINNLTPGSEQPYAAADGTLPAAERRNYTGVVHALSDIVKKAGSPVASHHAHWSALRL
jgi:hypothetical protein